MRAEKTHMIRHTLHPHDFRIVFCCTPAFLVLLSPPAAESAPGDCTPSRLQIPDVTLSRHPARAVRERPAPFIQT